MCLEKNAGRGRVSGDNDDLWPMSFQVGYVCWGPASYQEVAQHLPLNGRQYGFVSLIKLFISIHKTSYFYFSDFLCILTGEE